MALKSLYCVECICGYYIESETNTLICPGSQRRVVIDWHGDEEQTERSEPKQTPAAA